MLTYAGVVVILNNLTTPPDVTSYARAWVSFSVRLLVSKKITLYKTIFVVMLVINSKMLLLVWLDLVCCQKPKNLSC